jgi:cob(I)alamin adenosyltransferase
MVSRTVRRFLQQVYRNLFSAGGNLSNEETTWKNEAYNKDTNMEALLSGHLLCCI